MPSPDAEQALTRIVEDDPNNNRHGFFCGGLTHRQFGEETNLSQVGLQSLPNVASLIGPINNFNLLFPWCFFLSFGGILRLGVLKIVANQQSHRVSHGFTDECTSTV